MRSGAVNYFSTRGKRSGSGGTKGHCGNGSNIPPEKGTRPKRIESHTQVVQRVPKKIIAKDRSASYPRMISHSHFDREQKAKLTSSNTSREISPHIKHVAKNSPRINIHLQLQLIQGFILQWGRDVVPLGEYGWRTSC